VAGVWAGIAASCLLLLGKLFGPNSSHLLILSPHPNPQLFQSNPKHQEQLIDCLPGAKP
jgi:hypothetical protein